MKKVGTLSTTLRPPTRLPSGATGVAAVGNTSPKGSGRVRSSGRSITRPPMMSISACCSISASAGAKRVWR